MFSRHYRSHRIVQETGAFLTTNGLASKAALLERLQELKLPTPAPLVRLSQNLTPLDV